MDAQTVAAIIARFGPAVFFTVVAVFYTVRIIQVGRKLGRSPVGYGRPGTEQHLLYLLFRVFRVLIWAVAVARAVWPPFDAFLVPITPLAVPPVMVAGNLILVVAFAVLVRQHLGLGIAWRSGLADPEDQVPLLTEGPYRRVRHPMLAMIMLAQIGLVLAIPSLFTLVCLAVGIGTLLRQARLEEADMARRHGATWQDYSAARRAWPWSRQAASGTASSSRRRSTSRSTAWSARAKDARRRSSPNSSNSTATEWNVVIPRYWNTFSMLGSTWFRCARRSPGA